jgi:hypothetical protein
MLNSVSRLQAESDAMVINAQLQPCGFCAVQLRCTLHQAHHFKLSKCSSQTYQTRWGRRRRQIIRNHEARLGWLQGCSARHRIPLRRAGTPLRADGRGGVGVSLDAHAEARGRGCWNGGYGSLELPCWDDGVGFVVTDWFDAGTDDLETSSRC